MLTLRVYVAMYLETGENDRDQKPWTQCLLAASNYFPLAPMYSELPRSHPLRNMKYCKALLLRAREPDFAHKLEINLGFGGCAQIRCRNLVTLVCV